MLNRQSMRVAPSAVGCMFLTVLAEAASWGFSRAVLPGAICDSSGGCVPGVKYNWEVLKRLSFRLLHISASTGSEEAARLIA